MTHPVVQSLVLGVALVGILLLAVKGGRPSSHKRGGLSHYSAAEATSPHLFIVFLVLVFSDGYTAVAPDSNPGQVGAALGISLGFAAWFGGGESSFKFTGAILAVLALVSSTIALAHRTNSLHNLLPSLAVVALFAVGVLIGRLLWGGAGRNLVEKAAAVLALVATVEFLISPAGVPVADDLRLFAGSSVVAVIFGMLYAFPGVLIPSLLGIGVSLATLLGPTDEPVHRSAQVTFLVVGAVCYFAVTWFSSIFRR